eukprot:5748333-Amphidinium_carterae.1
MFSCAFWALDKWIPDDGHDSAKLPDGSRQSSKLIQGDVDGAENQDVLNKQFKTWQEKTKIPSHRDSLQD